jgi:hypothetical protein
MHQGSSTAVILLPGTTSLLRGNVSYTTTDTSEIM